LDKVSERITRLRSALLPGFAAGFLATLAFHQFALAVLYLMGLSSRAAFALHPTAPLGIPAVVSLAFWGALWGVGLACALRTAAGRANYWLLALTLGAVVPTLGNWLVSAPLHGQPLGYGWHLRDMVTSILVNGSWGTGVAILLRLRFVRWAGITAAVASTFSPGALNSRDHSRSPGRSV
jgi:hypothetical protein